MIQGPGLSCSCRGADDNICLTAVYSAEFIPILIGSIKRYQPLPPNPLFFLRGGPSSLSTVSNLD